ncbi:MAG TPA: tetraacyldisaccharide 4'-kinase [Rudaea sp.]|nr:tetraacyldisaccharide 4'-kinase [Rudaea sp.]
MPDARALQEIWYGGRAPGVMLVLLSNVFGAASSLRRGLYRAGVLRRTEVGVPVIVVGNITVGGTGKTPLVIALVEALRERGWKPGVVSRGFGGSATDVTRVDAQSDPAVVGDEARLIFDATQAPTMIGRDRVRAAQGLVALGVDVIVSDDGLQHYRLQRDVEICVIDGARRFGNGRLLPAGPLREPLTRLGSFDFRVCNGDGAEQAETTMRLSGDSAIALTDPARNLRLTEIPRAHAVAGIGNPARFFDALRAAGVDVIEHPFPDHHAFAPSDFDFGDDLPVLMTDKDAVKCRAFASPSWWRVPVRAILADGFFDTVDARLKMSRR